MIARTLVMDVPKGALKGIGLRTVRRQEEELAPWMGGQPRRDGVGVMHLGIIDDYGQAGKLPRRIEGLQRFEQGQEEAGRFARLATDVELIGKEEGFAGGQLFKDPPNAG